MDDVRRLELTKDVLAEVDVGDVETLVDVEPSDDRAKLLQELANLLANRAVRARDEDPFAGNVGWRERMLFPCKQRMGDG